MAQEQFFLQIAGEAEVVEEIWAPIQVTFGPYPSHTEILDILFSKNPWPFRTLHMRICTTSGMSKFDVRFFDVTPSAPISPLQAKTPDRMLVEVRKLFRQTVQRTAQQDLEQLKLH